MPTVNNTPREMQDGRNVTTFVDVAETTSKTFTFTDAQDSVEVRNEGNANITATILSVAYVIQPGKTQTVTGSISSIAVVSSSKTQQFNVTAYRTVVYTSVIGKKSLATTSGETWSATKDRFETIVNGKTVSPLFGPLYDGIKVLTLGSSTMKGQGSTSGNSWIDKVNTYFSADNVTFESRGVGGNTSAQALARFNADIATSIEAQVVIIGVTIGNEGFHDAADDAARETIYRTIKANILKMANKCKDYGKTPIIVTQFATQRYDATHLRYARKLNYDLEAMGLHVLDFMNAMLDTTSATAQPIVAASFDVSHANDTGQLAMAKSVPDIWSRIRFQPGGFLTSPRGYIHTGNLVTDVPMTYTSNQALDSFTVFMRFRLTEAPGGATTLFSLGTSGAERVFVNTDGSYSLLRTGVGPSTSLGGVASIATNTWYSLAMSWNKIDQRLDVYLNGANVYTGVDTLSAFGTLNIAGRPGATVYLKNANIKDVIVYRTKKQEQQIKALHDGVVSQASLELFAPMSDKETGPSYLINLAPTPRNLKIVSAVTTITPVLVGADL